jgi:hypothetical protein
MALRLGQEVYAAKNIVKQPDEHSPGMLLAARGEKLMVRSESGGAAWYAYVSHPEICDNSFGVTPDEITTDAPAVQSKVFFSGQYEVPCVAIADPSIVDADWLIKKCREVNAVRNVDGEEFCVELRYEIGPELWTEESLRRSVGKRAEKNASSD